MQLTHAMAGALLAFALLQSQSSFGFSENPSLENALRLKAADEAFLARIDIQNAEKARDIYREVYRQGADPVMSGWRLAMASYFIGLRFTEKASEKEKIFIEGRDAGLSAIKSAPSCAPCHFWAAINIALYGQSVGIFKSLSLLPVVRGHLQKSLEADPTYAYGGAHRLLGLIEQKLPGILGGSDDRAREHFEKAIETSPDEPLNYLFLATLLRDNFDLPVVAQGFVRKALSLPEPSADRLESREALVTLRSWDMSAPPPKAQKERRYARD